MYTKGNEVNDCEAIKQQKTTVSGQVVAELSDGFAVMK